MSLEQSLQLTTQNEISLLKNAVQEITEINAQLKTEITELKKQLFQAESQNSLQTLWNSNSKWSSDANIRGICDVCGRRIGLGYSLSCICQNHY